MRVRTELLSLLLVAAATVAASGTSYAAIVVDIDVAPPPAQVEVVPAPRVGYVWAPGFWRWDGGRHVWVGGHWMRERVGYHWVPEAWVQVGPHWHFQKGHWQR